MNSRYKLEKKTSKNKKEHENKEKSGIPDVNKKKENKIRKKTKTNLEFQISTRKKRKKKNLEFQILIRKRRQ